MVYFTNWKFGFHSDPRLHDLKPSCTRAFPLSIPVLPSQISATPSNGLEINRPPEGLNRGFTVGPSGSTAE